MKEVRCWTVAVGNLPMPWSRPSVKRSAKKALLYVASLEGFCGFHPVPPQGTLCLFISENDAKRARNNMRAKGIKTGKNICECFVKEQYVPEPLRGKAKYLEQSGDEAGAKSPE